MEVKGTKSDSNAPNIVCDICQQRGLITDADKWCKPCKIYMCRDCIEVHNSFRKDDLLISVDEILELKRNEKEIDVICSTHNLKLDSYCILHEYLGCSKCVEGEHNQCSGVKYIDEFEVRFKDLREVNNIIQGFSEHLYKLYKITEDTETEKRNLFEQKTKIKSEISNLRKEINQALEKAETAALEELEMKVSKEETLLHENKEFSELLTKSVEKSKKSLDIAVALQDEVLFFPVLIKSILDLSYYREKIGVISRQERKVHLRFEPNEYYIAVKNKLETLGTLITASETPPQVENNNVVKSGHSRPPMNERNATLIKTINVCLPTDGHSSFRITGGIYLGNERFLFCDFENRKMKLFKENGAFINDLSLISNPWDMCRVDATTVAVTQPVSRMISFVTIDNDVMRITSSISTELKVFGIGMMDDKFITSSAEEAEGQIQVYDRNGKMDVSVMKDENGQEMFSGNPYHLRVNPRTHDIAITQYNFKYDQARVVIMGNDFNVLKSVMDDGLNVAYGVDFDFEDNLYVCGLKSGNVIQLSSNGSCSRTLVECKDAHTIVVWDDKFLLASDFSDTVYIYQME